MPLGRRLGDFEITGVVHRGSFGIVYAAKDRSSQRKIAITEYLPARLAERMADGHVGVRSLRHQQSFRDGKQRFLSEAGILAALDEPALAKVLQFWEQHGTAYMAMPLDEGQTLSDVLRRSPKPCEAWLKAIFGPLLDALAALHRSDCYPYDVTPDNIVVLDDGTPLLSALGAARRIVADTAEDLTPDLNPCFAPIEQFAHDPTMPEGPWTDVYAVAAVLHFAITGKPLHAPTARMVSDTLPHLRDANGAYSASFLDAVERGLAVNPGDRPQTIGEFREALGIRSITREVTSTARPGPSPVAPSIIDRTAGTLPEPGPTPPVVRTPEGTRVYVPGAASDVTLPWSSVPEQTSPTLSPGAAVVSSLGARPWKLVAPLIVVGLVLIVAGLSALGVLVWAVGEPRAPALGTVDLASSLRPVPIDAQPSPLVARTDAQPSPLVAPTGAQPSPPVGPTSAQPSPPVAPTSAQPSPPVAPTSAQPSPLVARTDAQPSPPVAPATVTARSDLAPVAANAPAADLAPQAGAVPDAGTVSRAPRRQTSAGASAPPAPRTGKIQFSIKPWGEIIVDGKTRGVSPPIKELSIPEGRHRIKIRNGTFPGYEREFDIKAGSTGSIAYSFKAP